ncbi:hypothetical protein LXA43DRAFT_1098878 [Ganoderma leucocontextum]|nr:hypothetical protein LXA43DRAFT_1098878 [Ganoderma leucocontextum]
MPFLPLDERTEDVMDSRGGLPTAQGTFLIGTFLGILLYGLSTHQAYRYVRSFPTDAAYIRLLVIIVMILETLHVLANMHTVFHYLISSYSDPDNLKHVVWSLAVLPAIGGLVVVVSQIFFVRRVSLIGPRQRIMAKVVAVALVAELGFAIAATAVSQNKKGATISVLSGAALVIAAIADTTLTIALVQAFRSQRAREPRESESIIDVIQLYVINSGIATGVFNLVSFILAIALPSGGLLYSVFVIIAARLYANSLLAVLNSRELRGMEFFLSASFASVTLNGAQFADKSALWNVPRAAAAAARRPRLAASSGGDNPQFTNPWATTAAEDTREKGGYGGFR